MMAPLLLPLGGMRVVPTASRRENNDLPSILDYTGRLAPVFLRCPIPDGAINRNHDYSPDSENELALHDAHYDHEWTEP